MTREDGQWLADIPELHGAHTCARSLRTLDQAMREVIVLADNLPDDVMPELIVDYDYRTGDPDLDAVKFVARGLSVRDAAALLGISPQRVSQLTAGTG